MATPEPNLPTDFIEDLTVIRCQNGKLVLFDVGSRGGTVLNGQAIGGHNISNGEVISLGRFEFTMMAAKVQPVRV